MPHRLNTFSSLSQNPGHSLLFSYSYHTYIWKAVHNIHEPECYQLSNWDGIKRRWWCLLGDLWIILTYLKLICVWVLVSRMLYEPHPLPKSNSCEEAVVNGFFASSIIPGLMVQIQWDSCSTFKASKGKYRHTCSPLMALTKGVLQNMSW